MKWSELFTSSIGKKWVMALTGLFLITFLIVHAGINACIWANDGGVMFNKAAHFMGSTVVNSYCRDWSVPRHLPPHHSGFYAGVSKP